jgi:hypothetical protein
LNISGNDAADLDWLSEFLRPWCDMGPASPAPVRIRMVRSDSGVKALADDRHRHRDGGGHTRLTPCIRLDTQTILFEGWPGDDGLRLADPVTGCFFVVNGGHVDIFAPRGDARSNLALLGVVREAVLGGISKSEAIVDLHAGGFVLDGRAVVVAGPKGAGKTSLLCHAIVSGGADLLANDRVLVRDRAGPVACGVPTVVSIRQTTVARFPELANHADDFPPLGWIDPSARHVQNDTALPLSQASNLLLTPAGFAGRLGAARVGAAPLHAIVLPEVSHDAEGCALEALAGNAALGELDASLYGVATHREEPMLFQSLFGPADTGLPSMRQRLEGLAAAVPVYRCRLGRDAYSQPAAALFGALGLETGRT